MWVEVPMLHEPKADQFYYNINNTQEVYVTMLK